MYDSNKKLAVTLRFLNELPDNENGILGDKLKEFIHQATDLIYGREDLGPESLRLSLSRTQNDINRIANTLEKGEYDFDGSVEERVSSSFDICNYWGKKNVDTRSDFVYLCSSAVLTL